MSEPAPTPTMTLAEALSIAQGAMPNAVFDKKNQHFKNEYASPASIRNATQPHLTANRIALTQTIEERAGGNLWLMTTLRGHGETIESMYPLPSADVAAREPQKFGSALTYGRRYSLLAILGMSGDEDDDANLAQQATGNGKVAAKEVISPAQLETLQLELAELVAKDADFLPSILEKCEISNLQFMSPSHYDYTLDRIKARKKYLAKKEPVS